MEAAAQQKHLQLHWREKDRFVVVTPENEDRLVLRVKEAIQALKLYLDEKDFRPTFNILMTRLAEWIRDHLSEIDKAYLTIRDADLLFLVVRNKVPYDRKLEDELTDLDMDIAQDPDLDQIHLSVLTLPNADEDSIQSFLMPGRTLEYRHAKQKRSSKFSKPQSGSD